MGSPFFARALFAQSAITVAGDTARYPSSSRLDRVFCKKCGTRLFAWRKVGGMAAIALTAFDDRNAFTPTAHIWVSEKMDWVRLDDGLPQYPQGAP
jgi:hypothetical protein